MINTEQLAIAIAHNVCAALAEDIGAADLTAQLIPAEQSGSAHILCREAAILSGQAWFDACFRQLDPNFQINWYAQDGEEIHANQIVCEFNGKARALLTAERSAINFLQTLSATATATHRYVAAIKGLPTVLMDTRKTLPGLRLAQKYAVQMGGGSNQRIGLFDGILIKENHIAAAGSIAAALAATRHASVPVQIEVENMTQLQLALTAGAQLILLDNFNLAQLRAAVDLTGGQAQLEASGGIDLANLRAIAETGVQRISIGAITKHIQAIDFSMRMN